MRINLKRGMNRKRHSPRNVTQTLDETLQHLPSWIHTHGHNLPFLQIGIQVLPSRWGNAKLVELLTAETRGCECESIEGMR